MGRRRVVGTLGAVALAATTACAGTPGPQAAGVPTPVPASLPASVAPSVAPSVPASVAPSVPASVPVAPAAPRGLSASVVQYRRDAQRGVLQVKVTNGGDAPVRVDHVRLDSTTFSGPVEADKDAVVAAGVSADLTVPLGEPACGLPAGAAARHTVTLGLDGRSVELPVGGDVLETVAAGRCAAAAVAEQVLLETGPGWVDAGPVRGEPALRGTVVATPQPGARPLRLSVDGATTLFTVAEPSSAELPAGAAGPVVLEVVLTVTRCDPHAVAEDKKGYLLPVRVSVDGAEEVLVEVAVPVPGRAPLQDLLERTCRS